MSALDDRVLAALNEVRDPELDQSITSLGFVAKAQVMDGHATVSLRLPTYFCAPNFAYMMVADAHDALCAVDGITSVRIELLDHFASEQINAGVAAANGFTGAFDGEAGGELSELRRQFLAKAHLAGVHALAKTLLRQDRTPGQIAEVTLGQLPDSPALDHLRRRRRSLGLPTGPSASLLIDDTGRPIEQSSAQQYMWRARSVAVSIEGNTAVCRGLLETRYPAAGSESTI